LLPSGGRTFLFVKIQNRYFATKTEDAMPKKFTRQQLYDLAWTQPTRTVAAEIGISDVALAKICRKADVPIPPRGYSN
jgi:hypothetical protein